MWRRIAAGWDRDSGDREGRAELDQVDAVLVHRTTHGLRGVRRQERRALLHRAGLRRIRFHDLRHSTATLLLEQGVELVVIKELLGHAHIGVTATVYAHVRLRLQRDAIDLLGRTLQTTDQPDDCGGPPSRTPPVR